MQDASNAEMRRQIRREGRRWGLVPLERDGRIVVGQRGRRFVQRGDAPGYTSDFVAYVADVTMQHGFTGCLLNLRRLEERDANARADERQARIQAEAQASYDAMIRQYDDDANRFIRRMGHDEFINALFGPDPRRRG